MMNLFIVLVVGYLSLVTIGSCSDNSPSLQRTTSADQDSSETEPLLEGPKFQGDIGLNAAERQIKAQVIGDYCTGDKTEAKKISTAMKNLSCRFEEQSMWLENDFIYDYATDIDNSLVGGVLEDCRTKIQLLSEKTFGEDEDGADYIQTSCENVADQAFLNLDFKDRRDLGKPIKEDELADELRRLLRKELPRDSGDGNITNVVAVLRSNLWSLNMACRNDIDNKPTRGVADDYDYFEIKHYLMLRKLNKEVTTGKFTQFLEKAVYEMVDVAKEMADAAKEKERLFYFRNWPRLVSTLGHGNNVEWKYEHLKRPPLSREQDVEDNYLDKHLVQSVRIFKELACEPKEQSENGYDIDDPYLTLSTDSNDPESVRAREDRRRNTSSGDSFFVDADDYVNEEGNLSGTNTPAKYGHCTSPNVKLESGEVIPENGVQSFEKYPQKFELFSPNFLCRIDSTVSIELGIGNNTLPHALCYVIGDELPAPQQDGDESVNGERFDGYRALGSAEFIKPRNYNEFKGNKSFEKTVYDYVLGTEIDHAICVEKPGMSNYNSVVLNVRNRLRNRGLGLCSSSGSLFRSVLLKFKYLVTDTSSKDSMLERRLQNLKTTLKQYLSNEKFLMESDKEAQKRVYDIKDEEDNSIETLACQFEHNVDVYEICKYSKQMDKNNAYAEQFDGLYDYFCT